MILEEFAATLGWRLRFDGVRFAPDDTNGNVFLASMPDVPDRVVCVNQYGGSVDPDHPYYEPRVHVLVRGGKREGAVRSGEMATAIATKMNKASQADPDERTRTLLGKILWCKTISSPNFRGYDSAQRAEWAVDFRLLVKGDRNG